MVTFVQCFGFFSVAAELEKLRQAFAGMISGMCWSLHACMYVLSQFACVVQSCTAKKRASSLTPSTRRTPSLASKIIRGLKLGHAIVLYAQSLMPNTLQRSPGLKTSRTRGHRQRLSERLCRARFCEEHRNAREYVWRFRASGPVPN